METKFKIIETESYVLAVSDEETTEDLKRVERDWYYNIISNKVTSLNNITPNDKKIITYQPKGNAPELDLPLLPLLPEIVVEDDVKKLAEDLWEKEYKDLESSRMKRLFISAYTQGYKSATKVYSEKDLLFFGKFCIENNVCEEENRYYQYFELLNLWNKQPKTPEWFVAEMEQVILKDPNSCEHYIEVGCIEDICTCYTFKLKTTTINNKTYLVGHYEY